MAIPGPGSAIDVTDISTEFGGTAPHGLSEYYRGGGNVPDSPTNSAIPTSGQIALGNFYGSANIVNLTVTRTTSGNSINVYSAVAPNPAYVPGATNVTYKINPGVNIGSPAIGTNSITVPASFHTNDTVNLVNNGYIAGKGGNGANRPTPGLGLVGQNGGNALRLYRPTNITNNGVIAGGGGGGGSSDNFSWSVPKPGYPSIPQGQVLVYGASGGGGAGRNVGQGGLQSPTGLRAGNGSSTTGGAGRPRTPAPASIPSGPNYTGKGGNGGNRGVNGQASERPSDGGSPRAGGTRGFYIQGNPFATWVTNGTRLGRAS